MYQTDEYFIKLNQNDSLNINNLDNDDINYRYSIHTLIPLGSPSQLTTLIINGREVKIPGGFIYNTTPIEYLDIPISPEGVLIIGKKIRKTIFQPLLTIEDVSENNYIDDYVDNYFE